MNRLAQILFAVACMLLSGPVALAADVGADYSQGPGGFYRRDDRSGPYAIGSDGVPRLIGSGSGAGGGASTVAGSMEQDVRSTGTLNAATANAAIAIPINGQSTVAFTFSGLTASGATLSYEQSNDGGTTWTGVQEVNTGTSATSLTRTADGQVRVAVQGRTNLRVRVSTTGSGTITVAWNVSVREGLISLASPAQVAGLDGTTPRVVLVTTSGAFEPPTCPAGSGKCPAWFAQVTANTSTTLLAANPSRIGVSIQCTGSAQIAVSETGAALTTATPASGSGISLVIPAGSFPYFGPQMASRSAITAYTGTTQSCWGTEYLR